MALDLRGVDIFPHTDETAADATNVLEILLGTKAGKVSIGSESGDVYIYADAVLTDGGTPSGKKAFVTQNNMLEMLIGRGTSRRTSIYVMFKSATSGDITVILEEV